MTSVIQNFEKYCHDVLGVHVHTAPWPKVAGLPVYLREAYDFFQADLLNVPCLLAVDRRKEEQPPATIQKQLAQVRQKWNHEVVYLRAKVTSYNRQRLIQRRVPFAVPGNQLYLPMLCMDLRERFARVTQVKPAMDPSTQALLLYVLHRGMKGPIAPGRMAHVLGYTPMTMTRAFAELEELGIGDHTAQRKNRQIVFPRQGKLLWEQVLPFMRTPVRKRIFVHGIVPREELPAAGETALGRYSMLAEPAIPVYACGIKTWKEIQKKAVAVPFPETGDVRIELWNYPPALFAHHGTVDRLSLFLSLKDEKDERIAAALEKMLEQMTW